MTEKLHGSRSRREQTVGVRLVPPPQLAMRAAQRRGGRCSCRPPADGTCKCRLSPSLPCGKKPGKNFLRPGTRPKIEFHHIVRHGARHKSTVWQGTGRETQRPSNKI